MLFCRDVPSAFLRTHALPSGTIFHRRKIISSNRNSLSPVEKLMVTERKIRTVGEGWPTISCPKEMASCWERRAVWGLALSWKWFGILLRRPYPCISRSFSRGYRSGPRNRLFHLEAWIPPAGRPSDPKGLRPRSCQLKQWLWTPCHDRIDEFFVLVAFEKIISGGNTILRMTWTFSVSISHTTFCIPTFLSRFHTQYTGVYIYIYIYTSTHTNLF